MGSKVCWLQGGRWAIYWQGWHVTTCRAGLGLKRGSRVVLRLGQDYLGGSPRMNTSSTQDQSRPILRTSLYNIGISNSMHKYTRNTLQISILKSMYVFINLLPTIEELALLTHLVKLRRSCQQMILPDIRKCSKSYQIMGANRY